MKEEKTDQQILIDMMFEIGIMIHTDNRLRKLSRDEIGEWIAEQLRMMGFDTHPVGSSWGMLEPNKAYKSAAEMYNTQ